MTLGPGEKSVYIPKFGTVTARDLTDGVDMTEAQSLTITGTTHTTDEAGCKVIITKKLRNQLKEDAYRAAGRVIGNAMAKKIDQDGLTLFSSISGGVGSAGTAATISYVRAAITQLFGQSEPAPEPFSCILHPYIFDVFIKDLAGSATTYADVDAHAALRYYWRGNEPLFNVPMYSTGNIAANTADDSYGAVFSKEAFIYLVGWEPENWLEEDKSLRGFEIGVVADYAMVEEDDSYARYLLFDTQAPTS